MRFLNSVNPCAMVRMESSNSKPAYTSKFKASAYMNRHLSGYSGSASLDSVPIAIAQNENNISNNKKSRTNGSKNSFKSSLALSIPRKDSKKPKKPGPSLLLLGDQDFRQGNFLLRYKFEISAYFERLITANIKSDGSMAQTQEALMIEVKPNIIVIKINLVDVDVLKSFCDFLMPRLKLIHQDVPVIICCNKIDKEKGKYVRAVNAAGRKNSISKNASKYNFDTLAERSGINDIIETNDCISNFSTLFSRSVYFAKLHMAGKSCPKYEESKKKENYQPRYRGFIGSIKRKLSFSRSSPSASNGTGQSTQRSSSRSRNDRNRSYYGTGRSTNR